MSTRVSFGEVRDFASSGQGECCTDEARIECIMQECLQVLWSSLPSKDRQQLKSFKTVAGQSEYSLEGGASRAYSLMLGSCPLVARQPVCTRCPSGAQAGGQPTQWHTHGDKLVLEPTPDAEYTIEYEDLSDEVDCTLFTMENGIKVWKNVPLPAKYLASFRSLVRAKSVMEASPGRGQMLYNLALNGIKTISTDKGGSVCIRLGSRAKVCRCGGDDCSRFEHIPCPGDPN